MSMALVMSEMPDVYQRVLTEHVPDGGGRCGACRNVNGETASWPCQTYRIAQEAKWVGEGNLPGTGPHGPVDPRGDSTPPRRSEPSYSLDTPRTGDVPDLGFSDRPASELLPQRAEGGRRRRRDDDDDSASFGSQMDAPYGSSFGVDDRPRHAAR
ncbi:hypothetical protein LQ327_05590 [Actinomycetospora endophytica]|uniref:Uncharacterized protein n=1 Tax=Actinomycetospora endophytica TaxID=2291215 RepID=A0ABS8P431_9PSEU|nr:hypothetical protein [Actinomycetospora endophytica]MCD2192859.1 hypothetical protein [Actinomycetospora endophytica]